MIGDFQLESSERYDEFLSEIGVNWFVRQIVTRMEPIQKVRQVGNEVQIQTVTAFTDTTTRFQLEVPYTENIADSNIPTMAKLDGDKLLRFRSPSTDSGIEKEINEVREYPENGNKMVLTLTIPDKPEVWTKRIFKRIEN
ncbi:fatty acid-binding protein homolog 9 [Eurytemora carolleeae]|uniref:fatty acid-binding protein homolog 9 n=1 Tax=Eurytemora carolleeae TaxID=1294199 RepID=UPI000C763509|nr:fatty acid-binding protein homolog 9 [Eurytemora carolleeae]|eukprot:XP_023348370.1 fatty acid-binding protein homolog 9-like [Eurytemora affinis]